MSHYGYIGAPEDEPGYWSNMGPPVEEVTIEPQDELTCDYCGKPADDGDYWQDGNPILCNAPECKQRRQDEFIAKCQRIVNPDDQYDECPF